MSNGMEMMVRSLIKAMGINPDEVLAKVQDFVNLARSADNRMQAMEQSLATIEQNQRYMLDCQLEIINRLRELNDGNQIHGSDHLGPEFDEHHEREFGDGDRLPGITFDGRNDGTVEQAAE